MQTRSASFVNTVIGTHVSSMWQMTADPSYSHETILPKGVTELIFSFGDSMWYSHHHGQKQVTPRCFVNGMTSMPVHIDPPAHQCFFGIVLQPFAVKQLLRVPAGEFLDNNTDLVLIDAQFHFLWQQLAEAVTFEQRTGITLKWMRQKIKTTYAQELMLSGFLQAHTELHSAAAMASWSCYSSRQLQRKLKDLFGMNTETLLGYKRYLSALHQVHHSAKSLTGIAHQCGYYDQSHFIRDFKAFSSLTPNEYRRHKSGLTGHLYL